MDNDNGQEDVNKSKEDVDIDQKVQKCVDGDDQENFDGDQEDDNNVETQGWGVGGGAFWQIPSP